MTVLLLLTSVGLAADVLVPSVTPQTTSDFGITETLTEEILRALEQADVSYVNPSQIQQRAGEVAEGCADDPDCPKILWKAFPQPKLAIIGSATWQKGKISAKVLYYGAEDVSPVQVVATTFTEAEMPGFADQCAFLAKELLGLMPTTGAVVAAKPATKPATKGAGKSVEKAAPAKKPPPDEDFGEGEEEPPPKKKTTTKAPPAKGTSQKSGSGKTEERNTHGLPDYAWNRYKASGLSYEAWKNKALVRQGQWSLDIEGGLVYGDVDRRYDSRARIEQEDDESLSNSGAYLSDSFINGSGSTFGVGVGYTPIWFIETGLYAGLQVGHKELTTGWEQYKDGARVDYFSLDWDTVTGWMGNIAPRVRFIALPIGPVKPYALTALDIRIYDGYTIPDDASAVDYEDRPGGNSLGFTAGGGLLFDIPGNAVGFLEVPWTKILTPSPYENMGPELQDVPVQAKSSGQTLAFKAGFGVRL